MSTHFLLPPRLRKGDTIGLFCPAGPVKNMQAFEAGLGILHRFGFKTLIQGDVINTSDPNHFLVANDKERATNFLNLYHDERIQAIMAIRGGYGCIRMLPYLDLHTLAARPKALIGFSDISSLLTAFIQNNIISFHAPVVTSLHSTDGAAIHQLFSLITGENYHCPLGHDLEILRGGNATGRLYGGNLTTLVHLIGTPWEMNWDGGLLFLEDTGEQFYRIDRMLTQLALSNRLSRVAGILLGSFDPGKGASNADIHRLQEQVWYRVLELTASSSVPIWGNIPAGHLQPNISLPIGMKAVMNSQQGNLELLTDSVHML